MCLYFSSSTPYVHFHFILYSLFHQKTHQMSWGWGALLLSFGQYWWPLFSFFLSKSFHISNNKINKTLVCEFGKYSYELGFIWCTPFQMTTQLFVYGFYFNSLHIIYKMTIKWFILYADKFFLLVLRFRSVQWWTSWKFVLTSYPRKAKKKIYLFIWGMK